MFERIVRIEPDGVADAADLAEVAFALGRHAAQGDFPRLVQALDRFVASILERVFRDAHIGLWEEYAAGAWPGPEGGDPVGVHLSLVMGDQEEVLLQVPGLALAFPENDPQQQRDLSKGLRALADELDRLAERRSVADA